MAEWSISSLVQEEGEEVVFVAVLELVPEVDLLVGVAVKFLKSLHMYACVWA